MPKALKIVLTGAESTGKSTLAESLAGHFQAIWMPELARDYIEKLDHKYIYEDIELIAKKQIQKEKELAQENGIIFFDTWLIITKVWFDFVYEKHPAWLDQAITESDIDLFLVCDIDMPWKEDPLRENGGENRKKLHTIYLKELEHFGFNYEIVNGTGEERFLNAVRTVKRYLEIL